MKFTKLFLAFALFVFYTTAGFAQIDDDDAQMFMISRGMKTNVHDFGVLAKLTNDNAYRMEHRFEVVNKGTTVMVIEDVVIPAGFGVVLVDNRIEPGKKGYFVVVLDSRFIREKGVFEKEIILKTNQQGSEKLAFKVKGKLQ